MASRQFEGVGMHGRLDPRSKISVWIGSLVAGMLYTESWPPIVHLGVVIAAACATAATRKAFAKFAVIVVLPTTILLILVHGNLVHMPAWGDVKLLGYNFSNEGIAYSLFVAVRLLIIGGSTLVFVAATPIMELAHGLGACGVPTVVVASFVSSYCLHAEVGNSIRRIADAQRSRGVFPKGFIVGRVRVFLPILQPLIFGLIWGAVERSALWESRGYLRRCYGDSLKLKRLDRLAIAAGIAIAAFGGISRWVI